MSPGAAGKVRCAWKILRAASLASTASVMACSTRTDCAPRCAGGAVERACAIAVAVRDKRRIRRAEERGLRMSVPRSADWVCGPGPSRRPKTSQSTRVVLRPEFPTSPPRFLLRRRRLQPRLRVGHAGEHFVERFLRRHLFPAGAILAGVGAL